MPRLLPTDWRTQVKIFEKFGCRYVRQKGSHLIYHHPNAERAVVIPPLKRCQLVWQFRQSRPAPLQHSGALLERRGCRHQLDILPMKLEDNSSLPLGWRALRLGIRAKLLVFPYSASRGSIKKCVIPLGKRYSPAWCTIKL